MYLSFQYTSFRYTSVLDQSCTVNILLIIGMDDLLLGIIYYPFLCRGRDRYVNDEFDLDLTYITERIIGMSII